MSLRRLGQCLLVAVAAVGLLTQQVSFAVAGGGAQAAGVEIGPDGVLRTKVVPDPTGELTRTRIEQSRVRLGGELAHSSKLRKVSLNRLEAAVLARYEKGELETDDMKYLAGLTEIQYVFYYPETQDIVLAGPAEGFYEDVAGRVVGMESGKAVLQLQDLVVALRAFPASGQKSQVIGCSIDPTQEGLAKMQKFIGFIGSNVDRTDTNRIANGLKENLGLQEVSVLGISPRTHFAQVMVEADYRMKMIGIGLENPEAKIDSYISKARPSDVARNALARWYFTPDYESVRVSEDRNALELVGSRVQLIGENERVTAEGVRLAQKASKNQASQIFCNSMTTQYDRLASVAPAFAQLRNCMDMAIVAAYIQNQDFYGQSGHFFDFFSDESEFPVESYEQPKQVETAVNAVWKGNRLMTPIGGGVEINAAKAVSKDVVKVDENGSLAQAQKQLGGVDLADGQWWWD